MNSRRSRGHLSGAFVHAQRLWALLVLLLAGLGLAGCESGSSGSLRAESLGRNPVTLTGKFVAIYYEHDLKDRTWFMLSDQPLSTLMTGKLTDGQVIHIELLWTPKPGATPMDSQATNVSIRHIIASGGELAVYSGAGFATVNGDLGEEAIRVTLHDATLVLQESTKGFVDLLSPGRLTGSFTGSPDRKKARQMHIAASQLVTNALGRTVFVKNQAGEVAGELADVGGDAADQLLMPVILTRSKP
jgi:hypothetical protein